MVKINEKRNQQTETSPAGLEMVATSNLPFALLSAPQLTDAVFSFLNCNLLRQQTAHALPPRSPMVQFFLGTHLQSLSELFNLGACRSLAMHLQMRTLFFWDPSICRDIYIYIYTYIYIKPQKQITVMHKDTGIDKNVFLVAQSW